MNANGKLAGSLDFFLCRGKEKKRDSAMFGRSLYPRSPRTLHNPVKVAEVPPDAEGRRDLLGRYTVTRS